MTLTDNELRLRIAKVLGWTKVLEYSTGGRKPGTRIGGYKPGVVYVSPAYGVGFHNVPFWPTSLDAVALDLWPVIESRGNRTAYLMHLADALKLDEPFGIPNWELSTATAREHCEAWLKVMEGK